MRFEERRRSRTATCTTICPRSTKVASSSIVLTTIGSENGDGNVGGSSEGSCRGVSSQRSRNDPFATPFGDSSAMNVKGDRHSHKPSPSPTAADPFLMAGGV